MAKFSFCWVCHSIIAFVVVVVTLSLLWCGSNCSTSCLWHVDGDVDAVALTEISV